MRPKSIVQFEYIYWGIIALGLLSTALSWNDMLASVQIQRMMAQVGSASVYGTVVIGLLIQLALWYFIARRGSVVAKWIFVLVTVAFGIVGTLWSFATVGAPNPLIAVVGVATVILEIIAIVLLFRPDTPAWFGEAPVAE
ncbi:MAG: hypothetical protein V4659_12100 [Pseudomonadota bacterium]